MIKTNHHHHHPIKLTSSTSLLKIIIITTLLYSTLLHQLVTSLDSPSLSPALPSSPSYSLQESNDQVELICRMRGTIHMPTLHGTLFIKSNNNININGSIIGLNTLEYSNKKLPFHVHEFGNLLGNDGNSVGGHLLSSQLLFSKNGNENLDLGATLDLYSISDQLKVNNIINFHLYSHNNSKLNLFDLIGRSLIIHDFKDNGKNRIGQCLISILNNNLKINLNNFKYSLISKMEGNNNIYQKIQIFIKIENDNLEMKICNVNEDEYENYQLVFFNGGDISKLGKIIYKINILKNIYKYKLNNLNISDILGRSIGLIDKNSLKLLAIGNLGIAPLEYSINSNECELKIKQNFNTTIEPIIKSKFFTKIKIENDQNGNIHHFEGYLLIDYLKRKLYANIKNENSSKTFEFIILPNYFTKFLSVYLITNEKCSILSSQLHLLQIPLELKLKEFKNEIYQIKFNGFSMINGIHCEEWTINTLQLFDREFKTEINLHTSRINNQIVKLSISNTPIGNITINTFNLIDLNYPYDDLLEDLIQKSSTKCRRGNFN